MSTTATPRGGVGRRSVVTLLLGLALALMTAGGVLSWWVHHTVLDTPAFMDVAAPVATSEATIERITEEATTQVTTTLDLEVRIAEALEGLTDLVPDEAGGLNDLFGGQLGTLLGDGLGELLGSGPLGDVLAPDAAEEIAPRLAEDLEASVVVAVKAAVDTPAFRMELVDAVEAAHVGLVDRVRGGDGADGGDGDPVVGGDLVVDLEPLVLAAASQAAADLGGLPGTLAEQAVANLELTDEQARLVIVTEEQFQPHRGRLVLLDRGTWVFIAVAVVLAAAIVAVSRRWWGVVVAGLAIAVGATGARWQADTTAGDVLAAVTDPGGRVTATELLDGLIAPLDGLVAMVQLGGLAVAGVGIAALLVAGLAGRRETA